MISYLIFLCPFQAEDPDNEIRCGSIVVVSDKLKTSQRLEAILLSDYIASVNHTNLQDVPGTTNKINEWVAELTNNRIPSLVTQETVANTVILLLNALSFEGSWKKPFKTEKTIQGPFASASGNTNVEYMTDIGDYYFFDSPKLQSKLLRIPYAGQKYAMFIILPNRGQTLQSIATLLDHKAINREAWYMDEGTVDLKLPKFSVNYEADLKPYLRAVIDCAIE